MSTPCLVKSGSNRALNEELASRFSRWLVALNYSKCALDKYPRTVRRFSAFLYPTRLLNIEMRHFQKSRGVEECGKSPHSPRIFVQGTFCFLMRREPPREITYAIFRTF